MYNGTDIHTHALRVTHNLISTSYGICSLPVSKAAYDKLSVNPHENDQLAKKVFFPGDAILVLSHF